MARGWFGCSLLAAVTLALITPLTAHDQAHSSRLAAPVAAPRALPFMFEADARGGFAARTAGYRVRITSGGADIMLRGGGADAVALRFPGSVVTHPLAEIPLDMRVNH